MTPSIEETTIVCRILSALELGAAEAEDYELAAAYRDDGRLLSDWTLGYPVDENKGLGLVYEVVSGFGSLVSADRELGRYVFVFELHQLDFHFESEDAAEYERLRQKLNKKK